MMRHLQSDYCYQQIHIDAARNATDDFNLFHDSKKWNRIHENPFGMPIVLGFQLEALVEYLVARLRKDTGENALISDHQLHYSNYQFTFADVVRPGESLSVEIKKTVNRINKAGQLANRIIMRKQEGLALIGFQRESAIPLCMPDEDFSGFGDLDTEQDRSWVVQDRFFMKRKYLNTGNGKNFLAGSLVDQHYYFDELENRVQFPAMFPVALLSCALLEKAGSEDYLFEANPVVYTSHFISVDRRLQENLKSNDRLCLLVGHAETVAAGTGLGRKGFTQQLYRCFGVLPGNRILFRAEVEMAPLHELLQASS
jgi:acyl dehydratase